MTDRITADEIAIFLGTGLQARVHGDRVSCTVEGLDLGLEAKDKPEIILERVSVPIDKMRPIVRPLSSITKTEKVALRISDVQWAILHNAGYKIPESLMYRTVRALVSKHYDLFDWLGRVGADGKSLAISVVEGA